MFAMSKEHKEAMQRMERKFFEEKVPVFISNNKVVQVLSVKLSLRVTPAC